MQATRLPDHLKEIAADYPDCSVQVSITVDPLVLDEFQREAKAFPIVRIMERMKFRSEMEAQQHLQSLMMRANFKDQLASTDEERRSDEARSLVAKAFVSADKTERRTQASEALNIWPQCAEAYIVLAELDDNLHKRIELLEKGVGIACAQFDCLRFVEPEGFFWHKLTTRPYMRCRAALALALWEDGKKQSAIDNLKALLNFNPGDNQGLRFHLLNWLLDFDANDPSIDEYFQKYGHDESAFGRYANALWHFVRHGDEKRSIKALNKAIDGNKFVPAFLCRTAAVPDFSVQRAVRGTVPEAVGYYRVADNPWQKIDGALSWLRKNCGSLLTSKTLLRKIQSAEEYKPSGLWAGPMPMELSIAQETVWH